MTMRPSLDGRSHLDADFAHLQALSTQVAEHLVEILALAAHEVLVRHVDVDRQMRDRHEVVSIVRASASADVST